MTSLPTLPLPELPPRQPESHKGDFGRALLIGGSRGMTGAISLSGMAALRSGAGLVTLAVPDACLDIVAGFDPCYMTVPLACDGAGRITWPSRERIAELADAANCVACGPGLGRSESLTRLVPWIYENLARPLVVDADGLNALSAVPGSLNRPGGLRILTPHPGEFRRMVAAQEPAPDLDWLRDEAIRLAEKHRLILVLKGHRTLITDGVRSTYNSTGNPGLATGGTGDVLTGVITALVCQGVPPFEAAQLGVHVHGLAGDLAAQHVGQVSLTASDLISHLHSAFKCVQSR